MFRLLFLRHGLTKENQEERIQGQLPGTLLVNETERYLSAVIPLIRRHNPTVLVSSDLNRAVQTRQIMKNLLNMPGITETELPLLRERAMGSLEGKIWNEVPPHVRALRNSRAYDFRSYGGECDFDVRERVLAALWYLVETYRHERLCCITHAGWLHQLAHLGPPHPGMPHDWLQRTAIYEATLTPVGHLDHFHPLRIEAAAGF